MQQGEQGDGHNRIRSVQQQARLPACMCTALCGITHACQRLVRILLASQLLIIGIASRHPEAANPGLQARNALACQTNP